MICGLEFSNISKWSCCPRYPIRFKSSEIAENDLIFLNLDCFQRFMDTLYAYPPKHKFILITHNSDLVFTQTHLEKLRGYVNRIYPINASFNDPLLFPIPIGFVDRNHDWFTPTNNLIRPADSHSSWSMTDKDLNPSPEGAVLHLRSFKTPPSGAVMSDEDDADCAFSMRKGVNLQGCKEVNAKQNSKDILIYMNFNIRTNMQKRTQCYNTFVSKPWITIRANLPEKQFYSDLSKSKYVLSPEGTGIDCHRIYESMFLDTIPILKTSQLDHFYKKLPVLIVQDWNEVTEQFLFDNYSKRLKQLIDWKAENPTWTEATFWVNDFYK